VVYEKKGEENIEIVERFLSALRVKDLSLAPIADDIEFEDPMIGKGKGADALRGFIEGFLPAIEDVKVIQHIADGDYVVTEWEADGVFGAITILEKFLVRDGKILAYRSFYDPRPILG
jgi:limonene-1,2-epoxide hydrolase